MWQICEGILQQNQDEALPTYFLCQVLEVCRWWNADIGKLFVILNASRSKEANLDI